MDGTGFHVEPASWEADRDELLRIREQVFIVEQDVPVEDERDALDPGSYHVLARDADGRAIGTGRLTARHTIGRMAVLAEWRGRGVGAAMLQRLLDQSRALGYRSVELHAQVHAIAFYEHHGFTIDGEEFDECGIAHRTMRLELAPFERPAPRPLPSLPDAEALAPQDRDEALAAIGRLLAETRHELAVLTHDLDPALFDVADVLDAIRRVALSGRRARIRVLVRDPRKPAATGHRLITLAQRLPSAIELRVPQEDRDLDDTSAFLLNDRHGYLHRPLAARCEGSGSTCAPGPHRQLLARFDEIWERALPAAELRALAL